MMARARVKEKQDNNESTCQGKATGQQRQGL